MNMITHESKIKSPRPVFLRSGSRISAVRLRQKAIFRKLLKGGRKMTKVDLSKPNVPNQAPKWLGEYGKRLYPKLATYLNKNDKILRADEYCNNIVQLMMFIE